MRISAKSESDRERSKERNADKDWSIKIRERDNWVCSICGSRFGIIAHHIIPRENKVYKYDLMNGIALCCKCHKFSRRISAHNAPFAFLLWLAKYKPLQYQLAEERVIESLIGDIELRNDAA